MTLWICNWSTDSKLGLNLDLWATLFTWSRDFCFSFLSCLLHLGKFCYPCKYYPGMFALEYAMAPRTRRVRSRGVLMTCRKESMSFSKWGNVENMVSYTLKHGDSHMKTPLMSKT
jgi:hypothetical protein